MIRRQALLFLSAVMAASAVPLDRIVAVVDEEIILESELNEALLFTFQGLGKALPLGAERDSLKKVFLRRMIEDKLLLKQAEAESIQVTGEEVLRQRDQQIETFVQQTGSQEALERELSKSYGMTLSKLKKNLEKQIREQMLKVRLIETLKRKHAPTKKEVEKFFERARDSLPPEKASVHVAHLMKRIEPDPGIVEKAKAGIAEAEAKLLMGESFESLAEKFSDDRGSAKQGGDLGFFEKGFLDKNFEKVAFGLNPGEVSPITRSRYGFHLIKLEERGERQIRVRHILKLVVPGPGDSVRASAFLDSLKGQCGSDSQFQRLASQFSDDKLTRHKGGDLGWISLENLSPAYKQAIEGLSPGGLSPPVLIDDAYHLFRLLGRTDGRALTLENDFDAIKEVAAAEMLTHEIRRICERVQTRVHMENRMADTAP